MKRHDGRQYNELRPLSLTYNIFEYAPGSVLIELGQTKVLCAVTLQQTVPHFLRGQGVGWLTAEYALLPASTINRTQRESTTMKRQHRSVEISRLISRSLRAVVDLSSLGERSIMIDCDVLQADGGTRTASITGAFVALTMAQKQWKAEGLISEDIIKDTIAAVSVGIDQEGRLLLDPNFEEDSSGIADINFIMTHAGEVIEVQGGAEKKPIPWSTLNEAGAVAQKGVAHIASLVLPEKELSKAPFFSLRSRYKQNISS